MITQVKIPDGVYEQFKQYEPLHPEKAMEQCLLRFSGAKPTDRVLLIAAKERQELEALLDQTLDDSRQLVAQVRNLLKLEVSGLKVLIDPDTANLLKEQATFEGMPEKEFMEMKIKEGINLAVTGQI